MDKIYMAIDQWGNTFHGLKYPRKDLMKRVGISHVEKMFQDDKEGRAYQTGYVIGGHWLTVYEVMPMHIKQ